MADFRKWIYALAVVALLAGSTVPASAQGAFQCNANANPPIVRAEGFTELVGDLTLTCVGGTPTTANQIVPQINFQIFLSTNVTSRILAGNLTEALLIVDEPNSPVNNPTAHPILACGDPAAPDTGPSGFGVCQIVSTGNPAQTYDGTPNGNGTGANCAIYGCGRPNVFQARQALAFSNGGQSNSVVWGGVPVDPPGTTTNRTIRITNVRANAVGVGVSSTFTVSQIQMNISISATTPVINNPQQIVAYVQRGLNTKVVNNRVDFVQCNSENPDLFLSTTSSPTSSFTVPAFGKKEGFNPAGGFSSGSTTDATPTFEFQEGFNSAWKTKNLAEFLANGNVGNNVYSYKGNLVTGVGSLVSAATVPDLDQDVPGAIYNTESGFENYSRAATAVPVPDPPPGFGFQVPTGFPTPNLAFPNDSHHNMENAGIADHGTRLALNLTNITNGTAVFVPPVIYLYHQGTKQPLGPTTFDTTSTGVMVLTATDANGGGAISPTSATALQPVPASGLVVYEILAADPYGLEFADVPMVVSYVGLQASGLPAPGTTQAAGGFAPFYASSSASAPSTYGSTPDVPRFIPASTPANIFTITLCACNLLFPYVASTAGYDTGIAVANTSLDPGSTFGFSGKQQNGKVEFWYYGTGANGAAPPATQSSNSVPAGQVLTYVLSNGGGSIGTLPNGLDNRAAGFVGYIIAQAQFQYCHAFAFIGALGAGPTSPGISEGYLALQLDIPNINRTNSNGEGKAH